MARSTFDQPTNPYHYALHCIGGKWKMTILHEIYTGWSTTTSSPPPSTMC